MKKWILLLLSLVGADVLACDWEVKKSIDHMTDAQKCLISSPTAKIGFSANKDRVLFLTTSVYGNGREFLRIRVDDNPVITLGEKRMSSDNFEDDARKALREIFTGNRLRTSYRDYPSSHEGDAPICNLPDLIRDCGAPIERIMDERSQAEKIRSLRR